MDIQNSSSALDRMLLQILQQQKTDENKAVTAKAELKKDQTTTNKDIVSLSPNVKQDQQNKNAGQGQAKLLSEKIDTLENGYRKTQEFQTAKGNKFTRVEEVTTNGDRTKRIVLQQNESGSTSALENIFDRQQNGSFRQIQRFTDATGVTATNVKLDINPEDANILLGRAPNASQQNSNSAFQQLRGTQYDVTA